MKVGDIVLHTSGMGSSLYHRNRVKIIRETKLYWIVEFIFKGKDGSIFNRYERKYRKNDLRATSEGDWNYDKIEEIKNENS